MINLSLKILLKTSCSLLIFVCYTALACKPSFSTQYCQFFKQVNTSQEGQLQCLKKQEECPIKIGYHTIDQPYSTSLMNQIKTKQIVIEIFNKDKIQQQQSISYDEIFYIIIEEIHFFFKEIWTDIKHHLEQNKTNTPKPIQYSENFASLEGGAMILKISSNKIKAAQAILQDNNDKYLYTQQHLPIQIVIALKQEVSIDRVVIKSSQIYSSIMKQFILYGAFAINSENQQDNWSKLVEATAKNTATEQQYRIMKKVVRFLKLKVISAHGDWKYFTITQIKVYGSSLYAQAMASYKENTEQLLVQPQIDVSSMHLYQDLKKMITLAREGNKTIPQNNLITFFFQELQKLTKIEEKQILYLNELTLKIQNLTKEQSNSVFHSKQNNNSKTKEDSKNSQSSQSYINYAKFLKETVDTKIYGPHYIDYEHYLQQYCHLSQKHESKRINKEIKQKQKKQKKRSLWLYENLQILKWNNSLQNLTNQVKQIQQSVPYITQIQFLMLNILVSAAVICIIGNFFWFKLKKENFKILTSAASPSKPTKKQQKDSHKYKSKEIL